MLTKTVSFYSCPVCDFSTSDKRGLEIHISKKATKEESKSKIVNFASILLGGQLLSFNS